LAKRVHEICTSGAIGKLQNLEGRFYAPIGDTEDIRYNLALGGGATMDLGCYPIHWMRAMTGIEPEIVRASAIERPAGVDEVMSAELRFPAGISATMDCSMSKEGGFSVSLDIRGSRGALHVTNLIAPGLGYQLKWHNADGEFDEKVEAEGSTFDYQLAEFVDAVLDGKPLPTGGDDAINNMRAIDAVYRAAGLPARRGAPRSETEIEKC
jgi:predicted dehydrogenase